jgi:hypothetical protein
MWESKETSFKTGNGVIVEGFHGWGGLVMPPSPRGLSADLNRPRQRRKGTNFRQAKGRSTSRAGEVVEPMTAEPKMRAIRLLHTLLSDYHTPLPSPIL